MNDQPLPTGWRWANLGDLAADSPNAITDGPFGSNLKSEHYTPTGPRVIRLQNIGQGMFVDERAHISEEHFARLRKHQVTEGDLVVAILGERLPRACQIPPGVEPAIVKADCVKVSLHPRLADGRYINWWLNSSGVQRRTTGMLKGVGRPRINLSKLRQIRVAVPPLPEQRRIVAKIEELFSDLDAGVAALERVRANLKRYRAAVLKAAVEGRLTEEWRTRNPVAPEDTAAKLLERILSGRRAKWEQDQLRKFKEAGKTPPKGWKEKYEEPAKPDGISDDVLPQGWEWATVEQLVSQSQYGTSVKCGHEVDGVPVLRIPNIARGRIDLSDLKFSTVPLALDEGEELVRGDMLMCRTNGSIGLIGKAAVVADALGKPHTFASYLLRFRFVVAKALPWWVHLFVSSQRGRGFIEGHAASSAGQHNISLSLMHGMPIPLPPLAEQSAIVADVDRRLSVADAAEQQIEHALQRAARLRQSILKRAFEGRLVPQGSTDELASSSLGHPRADSADIPLQHELSAKNTRYERV